MIDERDKKIIEYFQKNPRNSFNQAARELSLAKGTVKTRFDDLVEKNLISPGIGLNIAGLKFIHALSFIEITNLETEKQILDYFQECPLVTAMFAVSGFEYNIVICLVANEREKISKFIDTFPLSYLPGVKRRNSYFVKESEGFSEKPFWFFFPPSSEKNIFDQSHCLNGCGACGIIAHIKAITQGLD
ncbi:MAG: Lrp/AsnC family transcriptional regulator [Candidatus Hodarchaeales archaeon]|jgi:DNA-binding Lrp family transcriptional regulator